MFISLQWNLCYSIWMISFAFAYSVICLCCHVVILQSIILFSSGVLQLGVATVRKHPFLPDPLLSLAQTLYVREQFPLWPWSDTFPSWELGVSLGTSWELFLSSQGIDQCLCHRLRSRPWTLPWYAQSGLRRLPSCTFGMTLVHCIDRKTFTDRRTYHRGRWR